MRALDLIGGTEIIAEQDCWDLLENQDIGRVALVISGQVDVLPVNYGLDGEGILFRSNAGRKMIGTSAREVAFEVDDVDRVARAGWSVVVHGEARDVTRYDGLERQRAVQSCTGSKDFLVGIAPRSITGRRLVPRGPTN
jgi:uncharacterized protein